MNKYKYNYQAVLTSKNVRYSYTVIKNRFDPETLDIIAQTVIAATETEEEALQIAEACRRIHAPSALA